MELSVTTLVVVMKDSCYGNKNLRKREDESEVRERERGEDSKVICPKKKA